MTVTPSSDITIIQSGEFVAVGYLFLNLNLVYAAKSRNVDNDKEIMNSFTVEYLVKSCYLHLQRLRKAPYVMDKEFC